MGTWVKGDHGRFAGSTGGNGGHGGGGKFALTGASKAGGKRAIIARARLRLAQKKLVEEKHASGRIEPGRLARLARAIKVHREQARKAEGGARAAIPIKRADITRAPKPGGLLARAVAFSGRSAAGYRAINRGDITTAKLRVALAKARQDRATQSKKSLTYEAYQRANFRASQGGPKAEKFAKIARARLARFKKLAGIQ